MKPLFTLLFIIPQFVLFANSYTTVSNGNWQNSSTWLNGTIPDPENLNGHQVYINHDITILNNNIKLLNGTIMLVNGVNFNLLGGNLIIENGTATFNNVNLYVESGWSLQQTTSDAYLYIYGSSVDIGQNFQNSEGLRYCEDTVICCETQ